MYGLWGRERGARADVLNHSPRAQSPGISTSKEQGSDTAARELDPDQGEEGRAEGAWPSRRGRALGGAAAAWRSRLWGLGFAALPALALEPERETELRSQRSHRDERRSRRLGFPLRSAAPAPRPDRWEGAAGTRTAPPPSPRRSLCPVRVRIRWGGWGEVAAGAFQFREDSGRPRDSTAPCPAHLRREPSSAGGGGAELRVFQEGGRRGAYAEGSGLCVSLGLLL